MIIASKLIDLRGVQRIENFNPSLSRSQLIVVVRCLFSCALPTGEIPTDKATILVHKRDLPRAKMGHFTRKATSIHCDN